MGIPVNQVMAVGDGENDIEMLELAGLGVAMGNANAHVKSIANVSTKSNDEDGVAEAVEKYVLKTTETPGNPATEPTTESASKVEASPLG